MNGRLLRECAVDLIRASDLSDGLALLRVSQVLADLQVVVDEIRGSVPAGRLLRDQRQVEALRSVA